MGYVKHPKFSRLELDGKRLVWCAAGDFFRCRLRADKEQSDGSHALRTTWREEVQPASSGQRLSSLPREEELDQADVDKIVKPEDGSHLHQMGYDFAILDDTQSSFLAQAQTNQKPI